MYEIKIESEEFKEKRTVQQHQMVNQVSRGSKVLLCHVTASERACEWRQNRTAHPRKA